MADSVPQLGREADSGSGSDPHDQFAIQGLGDLGQTFQSDCSQSFISLELTNGLPSKVQSFRHSLKRQKLRLAGTFQQAWRWASGLPGFDSRVQKGFDIGSIPANPGELVSPDQKRSLQVFAIHGAKLLTPH